MGNRAGTNNTLVQLANLTFGSQIKLFNHFFHVLWSREHSAPQLYRVVYLTLNQVRLRAFESTLTGQGRSRVGSGGSLKKLRQSLMLGVLPRFPVEKGNIFNLFDGSSVRRLLGRRQAAAAADADGRAGDARLRARLGARGTLHRLFAG